MRAAVRTAKKWQKIDITLKRQDTIQNIVNYITKRNELGYNIVTVDKSRMLNPSILIRPV